jgi:Lar family restriction alleviation protein
MVENNELKPCPFCGEIPKLLKYKTHTNKTCYHIHHICGTGRSTTAGTAIFETKEALIATWNKRHES